MIAPDSAFWRCARRVRCLAIALRVGTPNLSTIQAHATQQTPGTPIIPSISQYTYTLLAEQLKGQPLFPGLRRLSIHVATLEMACEFAALPLIFGPSIEDFRVTGAGLSSPAFADVFLPLLTQRSAHLKYLSIHEGSIRMNSKIVNSVLKFTELKTLDLRMPGGSSDILPSDILRISRALSRLAILSLDIHFPHHHVSDPLFSRSTSELGLHFPSTFTTVLISRSGGSVCECYPKFLVDAAGLVSLCDGVTVRTRDYYAAAADTLSNAARLVKLDITSRQGPIDEPLAIIPLLARLRPLQEVRIKAGLIIDAGSRLLPAIASEVFKSAPSSPPCAITDLSIHSTGGCSSMFSSGPVFGAGLQCLHAIARDAHCLENLSVDLAPNFSNTTPGILDATSWVSVLRRSWTSSSNLRLLSVDASRDPDTSMGVIGFEEADTLAQIMDILFPSLLAIKPHKSGDKHLPYWKHHWAHVERRRKKYQRQRTHN